MIHQMIPSKTFCMDACEPVTRISNVTWVHPN